MDVYATQLEAVPVAIRSRAGTIANELRAVLDSLACTLAGRNNQRTDDSYFPISKSEDIFKDDGMRKIRRLSDADKQTIIKLRPFRGGHPELFPLHEADRTRKHQRLSASSARQLGGEFGDGLIGIQNINGTVTFQNCAFEDIPIELMIYHGGTDFGASLNRPHLVLFGAPTNLPIKLGSSIVYQEPADLKGRDVLQSLGTWAGTVSDVLREFD